MQEREGEQREGVTKRERKIDKRVGERDLENFSLRLITCLIIFLQ